MTNRDLWENCGSQSDYMPFIKMHGIGNDFVIIDCRNGQVSPDSAQCIKIADRNKGIGCDQIVILARPQTGGVADVRMDIRNPDGSGAGMCGNAARCVGWILSREDGKPEHTIEIGDRKISATLLDDGRVAVNMGAPRLGWRDIPLRHEVDTTHVPLKVHELSEPMCISMGNPHAVFFVANCAAIPLAKWGREVECNPLFPERTNVEIVEVISRNHIRLRVWERGAGITLACGSGACAAVVAAATRHLTERCVKVSLDGGYLEINWHENGEVWMTGDVELVYTGRLLHYSQSTFNADAV